MPPLQGSGVRRVVMRRAGRFRAGFLRPLELGVDPLAKPLSLPDRQVHTLPITESHVIHEQECGLEEDLLVARRQAKKSWALGATSLANAHNSWDTPSRLTYRYLARCHQ